MPSSRSRRGLLPAGLADLLPPDAAHEARVIEKLVQVFQAHGYERVKPPLVEFETSLLGGAGQGMASRTFRVMDPVSRRMMGVRADMTLQIARIATTRLAKAGRPLRLAYAGEVLRVSGSQLSPERQFVQVGAELIGSAAGRADAEAVLLAVAALRGVGVERLSVDLMIPPLVPALLQSAALDAEAATALRQALDRKDRAAVAAAGGPIARTLLDLMSATGTAERGVAAIGELRLTGEAAPLLARLVDVVALIRADAPDLALTIDPIENRGFEYHSGISFSLFARGVRGELGRGGRYLAETGPGEPGEPATGFTLYMDTMLRALPAPGAVPRVYLPFGQPAETARALRAAGRVVVAGLEPEDDVAEAARRQGCAVIHRNGKDEAAS